MHMEILNFVILEYHKKLNEMKEDEQNHYILSLEHLYTYPQKCSVSKATMDLNQTYGAVE